MAFNPRITEDEFIDLEDEFEDLPDQMEQTPTKNQQIDFSDEFTDLSDEFEDLPDQEEPGQQANPVPTPLDAPDFTPEQLKKMSLEERMQYAQDLKNEREYRQGQGFTKGAISGATFGLSEKIPGLKQEEGEFLGGVGEFAGSVLPISKLYNIFGKPLVNIASQSPKYAKGLQSFARMLGFGATGAAYEGTKETVKTGEIPEPKELFKHAAMWSAFDGSLQLLGKAASFAAQLGKYSQSKGIPKKEALTEVMDTLSKEGIDPSKQPELAVQRAEEIIRAPEMSAQAPKAETSPVGITEESGQGAGQRIEYAKTGIDRLIDKGNDFIKAAKTPAESLKRLGQATNENIFNALAPLERIETEIPTAERASTKIRLAQSVASEVNSVLENGIFSNVTGNFEHGGLKEAYGDLTWKRLTKNLKEHEYSLEDLDTYRVSKSTIKRQGEGKKTGVDTQIAIKDINRLQKKYGPIDDRIRDFQKATLNHYGKDLLGNDLISKWNKDYYAPLFRVMDSGKDSILKTGSLKPKQPFKKFEGSKRKIIPPSESDPLNASMLISNARKNDSILQYRKLVEEGKLPGRILADKQKPIPEEILRDLEIDPELQGVAESLYNQTRTDAFTPEKNILRGWQDGKPFKIEVPEDIYNVFSTLAPQQRGIIPRAFSAMNRLFSKSISLEPRKFASIMSRDALSSLIYSKTGSNPVSIAEAMADIYKGKPVYKEFLALGGDVYSSRLAERIDRAKKIEDLISPGKEGILVPFEKLGDYLSKYSEKLGNTSLAVPLAEYKRALAKFGNTAEGRIMAAMEARRVTYDPFRKGKSEIVRELGNYIPFWNVSLQDFATIGRNLNNRDSWVKGFAAITVPTIMLKMANEHNPDYQALTPVDKAAFWHLYYGDKHIRVPIPWLLGTAFKVGAETFYDTAASMQSKNDPRAKEAWDGLYNNFAQNLSGSLPPLLQNYIEMTTNKSAPSPLGTLLGTESKAPEVIPRRLQDLPPEMQQTSKTSQLARWFGDMWGVSPIKLDRTIKNFGGLVAADALAIMDEAAYFSGLAEDKRPEQREANYLLLGNFVSNSPPSRTKYQSQFYDYLNEATRHKNAKKLIQQKGITDKSLEDIQYEGVPLFTYNRQITKLFKDMRTIEDDPEISAYTKKRQLDAKQREINDIYQQAVEEVRESLNAK